MELIVERFERASSGFPTVDAQLSRWILSRTAAFLLMLSCAAGIAGCRKSAGLVPVQGKVTLNGGAWPKAGTINFTPFKPAENFPAQPGTAHFDKDGAYAAKTGDALGLLPGEYRIAVFCWEKDSDDIHPGISSLPEKYANPSESGLTLKIEPGQSGPVIWNYDFPSKTK
jgi:hypothetical protein